MLSPDPQSEAGYILLRCYKESVQRLSCELTSLSSYAAFVIVGVGNVAQRRCIIWIGASCSPSDRTIAENLSYDIAVKDYNSPIVPECIVEDRENQILLDAILGSLWVQIDDYRRAARIRSTTAITNRPVSLYMLEKQASSSPACYKINLIATETPDPSTGKVSRLTFPTVNRSSVVAVSIGEQYDLWFGASVNGADQSLAKTNLRAFAVGRASETRKGIESVMFSRNLKLATPFYKSVFRMYFTTESALLIMYSNSGGQWGAPGDPVGSSGRHRQRVDKSAIPNTKNNSEGCSDCVGDTILRLLGLSSNSSQRLFWGSSSDAPMPPNPAASASMIQAKISRLTTRIDIKFLNPPRWGSKLLVLDLDHTLIDFSCRFDFMVDQLKRPFLDGFMSDAYRQHYDIAIWSQTNWKWLELKLTELGMLNRKDYKICFALDKSSMFTVNQNYIKPLQLIWNKYADRWSAKNTVSSHTPFLSSL